MPNITQKMLTQQLRELEEDGVINRIIYQQIPPKVEYELSEYWLDITKYFRFFMCMGRKTYYQVYGDTTTVLEESILNDHLKD